MHLRQKLTFMAFGSILTLAGYLLATIASDVTAQGPPMDLSPPMEFFAGPEPETTTFDHITCKRLEVVNEKGIPVVDISSDYYGGLIEILKANGKTIVEIGTDSNGGVMEVNHASGKRAVTIGVGEDSKEALVSVEAKEGGRIQLRGDGYGGQMAIFGRTDGFNRVLLGINERGNGSINAWNKNRYRLFP